MIADLATCRRCHACLNPAETRGLCPSCLLEASLGGEFGVEGPAASDERVRLGDYELLEEIGRGGMGVIYRARQLSLDRFVAVKTVLTGPWAGPDFLRRFETESRAAAALDHPHIVPIYEVGHHHGQPYYSMRLIAGRNLAQELVAVGAYPARRAAELLAMVARTVHHAHERGVLHRDLKPANILLDAEGQPHVTDFGLAKLLAHEDGASLTQAALGTPNYMAPEQASGAGDRTITVAADLYSLGAILFELLTGTRLFGNSPPLETIRRTREEEPPRPSMIRAGIPRDLDTICWKCLEKEPRRRYGSALALAEDLEHWLAGEPIAARRVGMLERATLWARRKPALAGLALSALAGLLLVSSLAFWRVRAAWRQENRERYAANLSLAATAIRAGSMDRALDYLMQCPEPFRHWEWGRLLFECLQEVSSIPAHADRPQYLMDPLIQGFEFSPDGTRLLSRGRDGSLAVSAAVEGRELFRIVDATNRVTAAAFRPGTSQLLVARLDGSLRWHHGMTGEAEAFLRPASPSQGGQAPDPVVGRRFDIRNDDAVRDRLSSRPWAVTALRWDRSGQRLVAVRRDGGLIVGRANDWANAWTRSPGGKGGKVTGWFSPDGLAVVVRTAGLVQRLDPDTGGEVSRLAWDDADGEAGAKEGLSGWASPTGERVVLIEQQGGTRTELRGPGGRIRDLGPLVRRNLYAPLQAFFSDDGAVFATTGDAGTARVYRADTGDLLFAVPETVYGGALSPDGSLLAVFGPDRTLRVWDVAHRLEVRQLRGHLSSLIGVAIAPDGRLLATGSREGTIKVWSARDPGQTLFAETLMTSAAYSPDGRWVATTTAFRGVSVWDARSGRQVWHRPSRTQHALLAVFSPDSRRVYVAGTDRVLRLHDVADGRPCGLLWGDEPVMAVECSPDGKWVATGDHAGTVRLWDAETLREVHRLAGHPSFALSLSFDPSSRWLASAGSGQPRIWDVASGTLVTELDAGGGGTWSAAFLPDGRHVMGGCLDHQIRTWEVPSGRLVRSWTSQSQGSSLISSSPDGRRLSAPSADIASSGMSVPRLEIWDGEHGRALLNLEGHREYIYTATFDRAGRRLLTASGDQTARQWEAFPWRDADYAAWPGQTLLERVRRRARDYWRERVVAAAPSAVERASARDWARPLPPGIPEWERDRWPVRDGRAGAGQLNLDRHYTGVLDALFYPSWNEWMFDDHLAELPRGWQRFGGVDFDVRGVIWLRNGLDGMDPWFRANYHDYPERVDGIAVGRRFRILHVLHGVTRHYNEAYNPKLAVDADGRPVTVATYVLRYADGSSHSHEIQYGRHLRHWWWGGRGDAAAEADEATVAWVGTSGASARFEAKVRLFQCALVNPRPETEVVAIDLVSRQTALAPFVVAMTVEP